MKREYYIRYVTFNNKEYYDIYVKSLFGIIDQLCERWESSESSIKRLNELKIK